MIFKEITEEEYRKFWKKSIQKNFLNAPEMAYTKADFKVYFLGVFKSDELISAIMLRGNKRHFNKYDFYAPRGILPEDPKVLEFLMKNLKDFLKEKDGYVFRIDPNIELIERDIDGKIVENGVNNEKIVKNLEKLGFKKNKFVKDISQIVWEFILPLEKKTEEDLLKDMKPNTRRRLKQALELGVEIKELDEENLNIYYDIFRKTADRKSFGARDFNYFKRMYELFSKSGGISYVVAVINPKKSLEKLEKGLKETKEAEVNTKREIKDKADRIKSFETRIEKLENIFPKAEDKEIVLSSGMFLINDLEILHLYGGNDDRYMKLDGQYAMQWEMIARALNTGCVRYNFYGVPPNLTEETGEKGVYEFKRGFSGRCLELIGEYELPLSGFYYPVKIISKIKSLFK